jgi:ceramide glucosyltransferase
VAALVLAGGLAALWGPVRAAHLMLGALALLCGAAAVSGMVYTLLAVALVGRFFARPKPEPASYPALTVVKAMHGGEWALLRNLSSFCEQDYPGAVQYLFGVNDPADPALRAVEELRRLHPDAHITVVADCRLHGANRKVSNIINMLPRAEHDVLVFADSDVAVAPGYLRSVVGELQKPGVGLVTCLYRGQPDPGFWPRLSAMATNYQFLPSVVIGLALGRARPCFGQTIAMRRETLGRIGGFEPFVNHLAEDHAIGEAVRAAGCQVAIPPFVVSHACVEASLRRLVSHELRWSRTIRAVDPMGHLGSALIHPLAFALLAVVASGLSAWSWALAAAALIVRLALKLRTDHVLGLGSRDLWLLPLWDLLSFPVFVASHCSGRVTWRGHSFDVDSEGMLSPVPAERKAG